MSDQIEVQIGSQDISVVVEGGALAVGMSAAQSELNTAVSEAKTAASDAEAAAMAAELATTNKLNRDGDNFDLEILDNVQWKDPDPTLVPGPVNLKLNQAPVSLLDMMAPSLAQDVRDGTNTGDFSPYLQAQFEAMINDGRDGTLPETPTLLDLQSTVTAEFKAGTIDSIVSGFRLRGHGKRLTRFRSFVAGGPAIRITHELAGAPPDPGNPGYSVSGYVDGMEVSGIRIQPASGVTGDGLYVENLFNPLIDNFEAIGFLGKGLEIGAFSVPDVDTTAMPRIMRSRFIGNDYGIYIRAGASGALAASQALIEHCWVIGQRKDGIFASGFSQLFLTLNAIQANGMNGGANDFGGMRIENFGVTPRNVVMRGNEWGNGNRAYSLKVDGVRQLLSSGDRWVTNSAVLDYATPKQIILGDGTSSCLNVTIERAQIVCDDTVTQTFLELASNITPASNVQLIDPDFLRWQQGAGALTQTLCNAPGRLARNKPAIRSPYRPAPEPYQQFVITGAATNIDLNNGTYIRLICGTATPVVTSISGGAGGIRDGEEITIMIENNTAGAVTVTMPANVAMEGYTNPATLKSKTCRFKYHSAKAKFWPIGDWSADIA